METAPPSKRHEFVAPHIRVSQGTFKNARNHDLYYAALFPPKGSKLRGIFVFLHGIGDHSRRYFHVFQTLCDHGFAVVTYDFIGHGGSACDEHDTRAHARRFEYFVDDTDAFLTFMKQSILLEHLGQELTDALPMILAGMSYGTLVGLHTVLRHTHSFAAMVLVAPAVSVEWTLVLRIQAFFSKPLSLFIPRARIVPGVNREWICRDPSYNQDFEADPLATCGNLTARMGEQSLEAMVALQKDMRIEDDKSFICAMPILFLMGSMDKVTSIPLAKAFYKRLASHDKEFKEFEGFYHCLFDEPERAQVIEYMLTWLTTRFPVNGTL